ncbi:MAG: alcohol dehydrogenase catalytic domain-containing protein [Chloroflexi bacterium]|nr:alcohol dehydrogenase catalytic domain-containing protein [Chloroflexota bacterium]
MRSVILASPGRLEAVDISPPPPPGRDEVQAAVCRVGICGTDLHAFRGTQPYFSYPRILGHELSLRVLAIGETSHEHDFVVGDLCCVRPYLHCGQCSSCRRGLENCCENLQVAWVFIATEECRNSSTCPSDISTNPVCFRPKPWHWWRR